MGFDSPYNFWRANRASAFDKWIGRCLLILVSAVIIGLVALILAAI